MSNHCCKRNAESISITEKVMAWLILATCLLTLGACLSSMGCTTPTRQKDWRGVNRGYCPPSDSSFKNND